MNDKKTDLCVKPWTFRVLRTHISWDLHLYKV